MYLAAAVAAAYAAEPEGSLLITATLLALVITGAYLLGAVPFGVIVCGFLGKDPREVGSGRTGGTNVYRTAGMPAALLTVGLDIAKGFAAVRIAGAVLPADRYGEVSVWAMSLAALAAIVGHNYSLFAGFRGGAGSSPNIGALLAFDPIGFVIGIAASAVMLFGVRIASLASLALSVMILVLEGWRVITGAMPPPLLVYAVGQLLIVVWALRPNIQRLRTGTERRINFGRETIG